LSPPPPSAHAVAVQGVAGAGGAHPGGAHHPAAQRRSPAGLGHPGHAPDRHGRPDGRPAGPDAGGDGHRRAQLLQPIRRQPHEVRRAGEEEEKTMAGEEGRGRLFLLVVVFATVFSR